MKVVLFRDFTAIAIEIVNLERNFMSAKHLMSLSLLGAICLYAYPVMAEGTLPYFETTAAGTPRTISTAAPDIDPHKNEARNILVAKADIKEAPKVDNDPRPYNDTRNASADVDATLLAARKQKKNAMVVMGANWCHDSRALAANFETQRFQSLISTEYEMVYVDVGQKDRNIDIANRFGLETIEGTPTIFIIAPDGTVLNLDTAPTWRHAASMESDDIYRYFKDFAKAAKDAR